MKFLVFSDSHGNNALMRKVISDAASSNTAQGIIFLGDYLGDIKQIQRDFPDFAYHMVAGNCDFGAAEPLEKLIEIGGAKILIAHGHRYGVKSGFERILTATLQLGVDAAFFGHSHIPVIMEKNGITLLNPGSITEPRGGQKYRSYAIVEIIGGRLSPQIVEID